MGVYEQYGRHKGDFVDRFQLDEPEIKERVLHGHRGERFSLSADGTRATGEFPWPASGMLYFRTGQVDRKNYRDGCNTYIAPDNSYMVTVMAGSHDLVTLYKPDGSSRDVGVVPPGLKPRKNGVNGCMWNPKWASDARHMVVAGPFKNLGPDRADIWLGQFADDFNSIAKWVQVTDNDFMDVYAYVWVDPGLGQYAGEAPYTLAVPPVVTGPGNWQWTFGDGAKGTEGKHSYSKAGTYAITATQGDRTLKGTVRVAERVAPKLLSAVALDDRRVLLTCSEPVQVAAAKVTLESGTAATKLSLDSEGSRDHRRVCRSSGGEGDPDGDGRDRRCPGAQRDGRGEDAGRPARLAEQSYRRVLSVEERADAQRDLRRANRASDHHRAQRLHGSSTPVAGARQSLRRRVGCGRPGVRTQPRIP